MATETEIEAFKKRAEERRATWPEGPWNDEPDREAFEAEGFPCIIQRGGSGGWCGYVGIPPGHPLHGKSYSGATTESGEYVSSPVSGLNVHGGITYAEPCQGSVCHIPKPGEPDNVWWLGFDCSHSGDLTPRSAGGLFPWSADEVYRDVNYVTHETKRLAKQLRDLSQ